MRLIVHNLLIALMVAGFAGVARAEEITVAAAISLKESLEAIRADYETTSGDKVKFTFASSGQLAAQITNGAPVDLFVSAARKQVDELGKSNKVDLATAVVVARNEMVLIAPADAKNPPAGFEALGDSKIKRIAIGEPRTVPAGEYGKQILDHLKLTGALKDRLIYGNNVRQVLQYVQSGEVDAGLVYQSDAKDAGVKVIATAKSEWHQPIEYWAAIVSDSRHQDAAKKFLAHLQTDRAQAVLRTNGFAGGVAGGVAPTTVPTSSVGK